jgi:diguanylate cyclase (GGDEF)-like protein
MFLELLNFELEKNRRNGQSLSVAFVDIDYFKQINDTLGHQKGDQILKDVAEILRVHLRKSDVIGRVGGDEFAIMMPETKGEGAHAALSDAQSYLLEATSKLGLPVTFSAGIVTGMFHASADQILRYADALMYEVKQNGRNDIRHRDIKDM